MIETHILEKEEQLLAAMKEGNVQKLDELIHEDLLFLLPDGQTITKEMDLANYESGDMVIASITATAEKLVVHDDTVVTISYSQIRGKYKSQEFEGRYKYLRIWKLQDANWKVVAGSCTPANV